MRNSNKSLYLYYPSTYFVKGRLKWGTIGASLLLLLTLLIHQFYTLFSLLFWGFCLLLYWLNNQQRQVNLILTSMHIQHHSLTGGWCLTWSNIKSIDRVTINNEYLPCIGIHIADYEPFLSSICLRKANKLILLQRQFIILLLRRNAQLDDKKLETYLFDDTSYVATSGEEFTGLLAYLANQMRSLNELTGFDLFIIADDFDLSLEDVLGALRKYKASA